MGNKVFQILDITDRQSVLNPSSLPRSALKYWYVRGFYLSTNLIFFSVWCLRDLVTTSCSCDTQSPKERHRHRNRTNTDKNADSEYALNYKSKINIIILHFKSISKAGFAFLLAFMIPNLCNTSIYMNTLKASAGKTRFYYSSCGENAKMDFSSLYNGSDLFRFVVTMPLIDLPPNDYSLLFCLIK